MKSIPVIVVVAAAVAMLVFLSCNEPPADGLAPYAGNRPLLLTRVTQNFTPDMEWLGGRMAAVGVNRGARAALDSTLVWLMTAQGNSINSPVTFGESTDSADILAHSGVPRDSISDNTTYTFWIATQDVYHANLDSASRIPSGFKDTTFAPRLYLRGLAGGERDFSGNLLTTIRILHVERLLSDKYFIVWTPPGNAFRRVGVNSQSSGAFSNLVWYMLLPDSLPDSFVSPLVMGDTLPNAIVANAFPPAGLTSGTPYFVWLANKNWTPNDFSLNATGLAWFRVFVF